MKTLKQIIIFLPLLTIFIPFLASASELPLVRVFYRADGGVSITHFNSESCQPGETVKKCMDRISSENAEWGLPYDDMLPSDIPQDRSSRDKWRGKKGSGIWIDHALVTRAEKIRELDLRLEEELDQEEPNPSKVLKLERLIEKVREIDRPILTSEDLQSIEVKKDGAFASVARAVGRLFSNITESVRNGASALASVVTSALKVGSPEAPAGITVYDQKTGEPYCLIVENGTLKNLPGECDTESSEPSAPTPSESNQSTTTAPTTTPPDIVPSGEPVLPPPTEPASEAESGAKSEPEPVPSIESIVEPVTEVDPTVLE